MKPRRTLSELDKAKVREAKAREREEIKTLRMAVAAEHRELKKLARARERKEMKELKKLDRARQREQARAGEREMILGWYQKWGLTAVPLNVAGFQTEGAQ